MPADILNIFKTIFGLITKYRDPELVTLIIDLQTKVQELTSLNIILREQLTLKESIRYRAPFFYRNDEKDPLCPTCWQGEQKPFYLVTAMDQDQLIGWRCPKCAFYHENCTEITA